MPTFCRHNRLIQNCTICAREQGTEVRPIVSSSAPRVTQAREAAPRASRAPREAARAGAQTSRAARGGAHGMTVRRLQRGAEDGYGSPLVPGLKSSVDADRLAHELAFAAHRLEVLTAAPPGLYAEVAGAGDIEERTWLAVQISYLGTLDEDDPFRGIAAVRTPWAAAGDAAPPLDGAECGRRTALRAGRAQQTVDAYRAWVGRSGGQQAAFAGEAVWTPERRFARIFERLGTLPGLTRGVRFDLLVTLGALGVYALSPGALELGGENEVTVAAKRLFGIGDQLLLERRAAGLARSADLPLAALDLALYNWGTGYRTHGGLAPGSEPAEDLVSRCRDALEV